MRHNLCCAIAVSDDHVAVFVEVCANNANTLWALDTFCFYIGIYTIDMPITVLDCDCWSVTVLTRNTLDTLLTLCTIGYCKCGCCTIGVCNCVSIYKTFGICFLNRSDTVTSFALETFCKYVCIYSINIPISILDSNNWSVTIFTWFALNTLDTLCAVLSIFTIGYCKCGSCAISESDCICIYKTYCICFLNGSNSITSLTLNSFGKYVCVYSINIPVSILDCNYWSMTINTWYTLNTLDTLCTVLSIFTIGYCKCGCSTICESDCVCIYQSFG